MNSVNEFTRIYKNVGDNIASSMAAIDQLDINNEEGKTRVSSIMQKLETMQSQFNNELTTLEENAEWEKFTIAFFGETNAGKSTIIESLRILFDEKERRELLERNERDLEKFKVELNASAKQIQTRLVEATRAFYDEISSIRNEFSALELIAQEESSSRIKKRFWLVGGSMLLCGVSAGVGFAMVLGL